MKTIDVRFSKEIYEKIQSMVNQEFKMIRHDPLIYGPGAYGIVGVYVGDKVFAITNQTEVLDYYGTMEDVAVFRFDESETAQIASLTNNEMVNYPIKNIIKEIRIVNENQQLFQQGTQIYDVHTVRGIIFVFQDGREISFEKPVWFSEDIYIEKGYDLYDKFAPTDAFLEDWEDGYTAKCTRETVTFS